MFLSFLVTDIVLIIPTVMANLHIAFDRGLWFLLPTSEMIGSIFAHSDERKCITEVSNADVFCIYN